MENQYLCIIGPDESYSGGMLNVIHQILWADFLHLKLERIHIGTASKKAKVRTFIQGLIKLIRMCSKHKVAIVDIQLSERGSLYRTIIILNICKMYRVKTIIHSHGGEFFSHLNSIPKWKCKIIKDNLCKADRVIVLTEGWKKIWRTIVDENIIRVIPNGTDISPIISRNYFRDRKYNILFLGNISPIKGVNDLIDAVTILKSKIPVCLRIAGGNQVEECRQYVIQKKANEYVSVVGWVEGDERELLFAESDILVLPSYYESFGLVAIEAMAHRVPVICGDKGFTKEVIIDGESGLVCRTGDVNDIAAKLLELYDLDKITQFAECGYNLVKDHYTVNSVMEKLEKIYIELIGELGD